MAQCAAVPDLACSTRVQRGERHHVGERAALRVRIGPGGCGRESRCNAQLTSPSNEQAADPSVHGHGQWRGAARRVAAEQRRRAAAARAQPNTKRRGVGDSLLPTTPSFLPRPRSAFALPPVSAWA